MTSIHNLCVSNMQMSPTPPPSPFFGHGQELEIMAQSISFSCMSTSMNREQELRKLGWYSWVWPWSPFLFGISVGKKQCSPLFRQLKFKTKSGCPLVP